MLQVDYLLKMYSTRILFLLLRIHDTYTLSKTLIYKLYVKPACNSGIITLMNTATISITILAFLCVAGAIGAIIFAASSGKKSGGASGWTAQKPKRSSGTSHVRAAVQERVKTPAPQPQPQAQPKEPVVTEPQQIQATPQSTPPPAPKEETRIWSIPHSRNPRFFGREKVMDELRNTLAGRRSASIVEAKLGAGGIGKTQIAVEYAHRFANKYKIVWWLRATHESTLSADFSALAHALDLKMDDSSPNAMREAVTHTLSQKKDWLLIFDDAVDTEIVRRYIPPGEEGHIIITSTTPDWWQFTVPITLDCFDRIESIDLLYSRTKQTNGAIVGQLAALLHDLPLAIDQANAYSIKTGKSAADFLSLFRSRKKDICTEIAETMDREQIAEVALSLSLELAKKEAGASDELLNLLAFFSSEGIPLELLKTTLKESAIINNTLQSASEVDSALAALQHCALIELGNDILFVHGLVQKAARNRLNENEQQTWAKSALHIVDSMFQYDARDRVSRDRCSQLLPHALMVVDYAAEHSVDSETAAALLGEVSVYLRGCGHLRESVELATKALSLAEVAYGSGHPKVAVCADTLGRSLQVMGDREGARNQYERALKIDEAAYGPNHPSVATRLGNMGEILRELGCPLQARAHLERALMIAETTYGPNHANVAARAASLGQVLEAMGDYAEAKKLYEQALAIDEVAYGLTHPGVADRVHLLGEVLCKLGDPDRARMCFARALKIEQSTYGHDHPRVAMRVACLGHALESVGDFEGARDCYEEALAIDEACYGHIHPNLTQRVDSLGRALEKMGEFKAAKECYMQALAIEETMHGPDHPNVADKVIKLGKAYKAIGDLFSAQSQFERAVEIHQAALGPTHPEVANDLVLLGNVLNEMGDSKTARTQLGRALLIRQEQLGLTHPDTESVRKSLATFAY